MWMIGRKRAQQLRHARRHPAIPPTPEERRIGRVEEQAVRLLQRVQVGHHRSRGAVKVVLLPSNAGCELQLALGFQSPAGMVLTIHGTPNLSTNAP
jgi:hypothetical protein